MKLRAVSSESELIWLEAKMLKLPQAESEVSSYVTFSLGIACQAPDRDRKFNSRSMLLIRHFIPQTAGAEYSLFIFSSKHSQQLSVSSE